MKKTKKSEKVRDGIVSGGKPVPGNRAILLFLASQAFSNFGDALRAVAIVILLYKITGSGLSAGLSVVYSIVPGILLSTLAGGIGDVLPPKSVLIAIELLRSAVITLFIRVNDAASIYIFLIILASLDALNNPSLRKMTVGLAGRDRILAGNSVLSGITGITNILGSCLAGIWTGFTGTGGIFLLNSILHAISGVLILFIPINIPTARPSCKHANPGGRRPFGQFTLKDTFTPAGRGLHHPGELRLVKNIIFTGAVVSFGLLSVNIAFHPFAFDVLRVSGRGWGFIMSVFYASNALAMAISLCLGKKLRRFGTRLVYAFLFVTASIWFLYSILEELLPVLFLQLVEGTVLSLCVILLVSELQLSARTDFLARMNGIYDFAGNIGKTAAAAYAYFVIRFLPVRYVFLINSILALFYVLYKSIYQPVVSGRIKSAGPSGLKRSS